VCVQRVCVLITYVCVFLCVKTITVMMMTILFKMRACNCCCCCEDVLCVCVCVCVCSVCVCIDHIRLFIAVCQNYYCDDDGVSIENVRM